MFTKILIANRGEIACRVAATCRRLGIATVAVFSDADAQARHVAACDEGVHIGGAAASDSYLRAERIVAAALATGAQAVHPGYGFLSENEAFARACEEAGIEFIGPPVSAIAAMGSKAAAKALMQSAGVPLVPGYHGAAQDAALLQREADAMSYPVLLKASAGGGGKGMRVVERSQDFAAALASCQREAASSFGDARVLIEKYLQRPRHVEVQVFADKAGNAVYLFDRDCSVQRRHQKVLEEAPAPALPEATRRAMGEAAVAAARAVKYVGAGTVEFIVDSDGRFYFMEMNTRLQVEHPVTEMVTGLDLVEWQLRVAADEHLPLAQTQLRVSGHSIEARIYAENPARGFLPSTGILKYLRMPEAAQFSLGGAAAGAVEGATMATVRVDSGVREGDAITPFYDPMIAKLIVHGSDRTTALAAMARALREVRIVGPHTNVAFLQRLIASQPFAAADLDTGLIERHHDTLFAPRTQPFEPALALAHAALLAREAPGQAEEVAGDAATPWTALPNWRLNSGRTRLFTWDVADGAVAEGAAELPHVEVAFFQDGASTTLALPGRNAEVFNWRQGATPDAFEVSVGALRTQGQVFAEGDIFHVFCQGERFTFVWQNLLAHAADAEGGEGRLTAPMPGKVIALLVEPGARVAQGTPLLVMEAMKMEHTIGAPAAGIVREFLYAVGDQVADGAQLLVMETE
ncbi:MAG: biotin carboxylase N-terminal domain-containing protein [Janthinobacterium lividum]